MLGIDAPEIAHDGTPAQCHAVQAAARTRGPGGRQDRHPRVRIDAKAISVPTRSRRRRTIDPDQGEQGEQAHTVRDVVAWFRRRTDIEESPMTTEPRIREAKLGAGLRQLPSASHTAINTCGWAALLAGSLSLLLQP